MKLITAQSGTRMADNLWYAAAQTFALIVTAADWNVRGYLSNVTLWPVRRLLWKIMWLLWKTKHSDLKIKIQGLQKACKALGLEKGKQLAHRPTTSSESNAPDLDRISEKAEEVDVTLSSLTETDFAGHFRPVELDYDSFRRFYRRLGSDLLFTLALGVWLSYAEFDHTPFYQPLFYFRSGALMWMPRHSSVPFSHFLQVFLANLGFLSVSTTGWCEFCPSPPVKLYRASWVQPFLLNVVFLKLV
ncbi:unnamed protein product [Lactuca saligna]|uniref:Uncharacterized protein n=1 Tax=Lactuca saligna TaxID=75948 RepID=A0AA36EI68_LACSI|nr:unnamed protein product [Lactuca saligna]